MEKTCVRWTTAKKEVKKKHMCAKHLREVSFAIVRLSKLCQKPVHKKKRIPIA